MSLCCPRCGQEGLVMFSDSVLKTHGFTCCRCHRDCGVDDGRFLQRHIDSMVSFYYRHTLADQTTQELTLTKDEDGCHMVFSLTQDNVRNYTDPTPFDEDLYKQLASTTFGLIFILDWEKGVNVFITPETEYYKIEIKFSDPTLETVVKEGYVMPPLLPFYDSLYRSLQESVKFNDEQTEHK